MVYAATLSDPRRVMRWWLVLEYFGTNVQHIYGVENIVADLLRRLISTYVYKYKPSTKNTQCRTNNLFVISTAYNNEDCFPLNILNVKIKQQEELIKVNSKILKYISDWVSVYSKQALEEFEIIWYASKIYVPQTLSRLVIYWYHLYINHTGGSRLL